MNTFKRLTASISLSTAFFAHNVQAAPTDAVCVALGKWGRYCSRVEAAWND